MVEGMARVIMTEAHLGELQPGEILVAPGTSSQWTPAFEIVKGIVTDGGGALSHACIVAREYGIPAVTGHAGGHQEDQDRRPGPGRRRPGDRVHQPVGRTDGRTGGRDSPARRGDQENAGLKHIVIIVTLDTKSEEAAYLRDRIVELGHRPLILDTGLWRPARRCRPTSPRRRWPRPAGADLDDHPRRRAIGTRPAPP